MNINSNLNSEFEESERQLFIERSHFLLLYIGWPMILIFSVCDYFIDRKLFTTFLIVRPICALIIILMGLCTKLNIVKHKYVTAPVIISTFAASFLINYGTILLGTNGLAFYQGIVLLIVTIIFFFPWPKKELVLALLIVYLPYPIYLYFSKSISDVSQFIVSLMENGGFVFLSYLISKESKNLRQQVFIRQKRIQKINDEMIEQSALNKRLYEIARQAAHDIRSPLSALNLAIESLPEPHIENKNIVKNVSTRINKIAQDLLYDSANASDTIFDAKTAILNLIKETQLSVLGKMTIHINFDFNYSGLVSLDITETDFVRIVSNLINNSIESFVNGNGQIKINLQVNDDLKLSIEDNGPGIPPNVINKIGIPGNTEGKTQGCGLGLLYCKSVIDSVSGSFVIDSNKDGTKIKITLNLNPTHDLRK